MYGLSPVLILQPLTTSWLESEKQKRDDMKRFSIKSNNVASSNHTAKSKTCLFFSD